MKPESVDLDKLVNLQSDRHQALRLDQVEELRNAFRETHSVIVNLDGFSDSSYATNNFQSEFEERYMDAYCALAEDFDRLGPENTTPTAAAGNADPELRVNMPQMSVPKFSGACVDWPGYYDAFTSLIHNNNNLSNVQRLHFLKESLPISRDNDIRQMQLTDVNYAVAWGMMIKRYNNPRLVFSHHMKAIYALPRLQKDSTDSLRSMLSTVNVCLAAFRRVQALGGESQHWLVHYLASKLPKATHNAWEHHQGSSSTVPSYRDLESFLNDRLVIMDAIENRSSSYDSNAGPDVDSAYVLNSVTSGLPSLSFSPKRWDHIQGLPLADPSYYRSKRVDLILGVDLLAQIMLPDTKIGLPDEPIARLGWILSGRAEGVTKSSELRCHRVTLDTESLLKRFCEVESVPDRSTETEEDTWRLSNNPGRWNKYVEEIEEYFSLEQIAPAVGSESSLMKRTSSNIHVASCVHPHHAVFKEELHSTKQRIVFDASSRTSNGRSLNDILCIGPTLQNDMSSVILNWRKYRFVFTADIQKMYRCIDVHPEDAQFQRILWRAADGAINVFALSTLTFETASAPFTAIRVIQHLAKDEQLSFPMAEEVLMNEIYVDDILSGGHTIEEAEDKRLQVSGAIKSARKWASNDSRLLLSIPSEYHCTQTLLSWDTTDPIKALGMYWLPNKDCFKYQINFGMPVSSTKRMILSSIARLFVPLGLIAPVIISGKLILKEVTMAKTKQADGTQTVVDWDDAVPDNIAERDKHRSVDPLHPIFNILSADACILRRIFHILCSRCVPKNRASGRKMLFISDGCKIKELSGAVLAIKLVRWLTMAKFLSSFLVQTFYFTDATIVLHWLHGDVNKWKTFVANRVAFVLDHSSPIQWRHVSTTENPADCATRGLTPIELKDFELWWRGPEWLVRNQDCWPSTEFGQIGINDAALEARVAKMRVHHAVPQPSFLERFSTLSQALRVTGYIMRVRQAVVRIVQRESFATDLSAVRNSKRLPSRSKLLNLSPILEEGILRVRGRLRHSSLSHERRHPIILPSSHHFTELVIRHSHCLTLHGGAQLTLAHARQRFWILTGRQAVRRVIRFRTRPTTTAQLMGDLPVHRVNPPSRPFIATGVDYTGAIEIKAARLRYIAVFICLATKAVHLEAVTGLTPEHFLLALDRFTGRRGMVQHLYSDNGTNFVGADNRITWHFNPPLSPNFGGLWEANVKSVKHHLKRVIADRRLTYEELSSVLVSIEACLNSRPPCPLTADPDDLEVLTPAHFLIGDSMLAPPEYQPQSRSFAEQFLIQQTMIRHFWKAWSRDWLAHLQQRPKWC
ncbi:uncharacterized protein LOC123037303 [Drosophila rhopaloa]|uniref:Integrase catalytic domain-containing protein n=1 Tax=Drosophila rhopaloa TaxID=1041015 RepID=A0ABM5J3A9_DRORH|nr:uncharacterized protein LOC123037303 [Drosophila rhopaloa]